MVALGLWGTHIAVDSDAASGRAVEASGRSGSEASPASWLALNQLDNALEIELGLEQYDE